MVVDHSPSGWPQAQATKASDPSPISYPIENLLDYYLTSCRAANKSPLTTDSYRQRLKAFLDFAGNDFSPHKIRLFLLSLQERGCQPSTVNVYYRALHVFFETLATEELIPRSPMEHIKPPRVPKKKVKGFSREDIDRLLMVTSGNNFLDIRNRVLILLFYDTGMRLREMTGIQLKDINETARTIKILGKGDKERIVPFGVHTYQALLKYLLLRGRGPGPLWLTEERREWHASGVKVTIKRLCQRADIKNVKRGPHTFRHTAATSYIKSGGNVALLKELLGHSKIETTMIYLRSLDDEAVIEAHKKFSPVDNLGLK